MRKDNFRNRVIKPAVEELRKTGAWRLCQFEMRRDKARGRPIHWVEFIVGGGDGYVKRTKTRKDRSGDLS